MNEVYVTKNDKKKEQQPCVVFFEGCKIFLFLYWSLLRCCRSFRADEEEEEEAEEGICSVVGIVVAVVVVAVCTCCVGTGEIQEEEEGVAAVAAFVRERRAAEEEVEAEEEDEEGAGAVEGVLAVLFMLFMRGISIVNGVCGNGSTGVAWRPGTFPVIRGIPKPIAAKLKLGGIDMGVAGAAKRFGCC